MDLLRPRFIISDIDMEQPPSSAYSKPRPPVTRRNSAEPDMVPTRVLIEETPSRANSRRGSLTTMASASPKTPSSAALSPRTITPAVAETKPTPAESCLLRSIFDAITTTEMAYVALQRRQVTEAKEEQTLSRSGRHRVMQSIREIGSMMTLTPEQHLTEQMASIRRELTKLRGDHERQLDQIKRQRDQLEMQRAMAHNLVKQLRKDLHRVDEQKLDWDLLRQIVTTAMNLETVLAMSDGDVIGGESSKDLE